MQMAKKKSGFIRRGSSLLLKLILLIAAMMIAGFILIQIFPKNEIADARDSIKAIAPILTAIRISIMASIIIFWGRICNFAATRYKWSSERLAATTKQRWQYAVMFVVLEFCINYRLIESLFR